MLRVGLGLGYGLDISYLTQTRTPAMGEAGNDGYPDWETEAYEGAGQLE